MRQISPTLTLAALAGLTALLTAGCAGGDDAPQEDEAAQQMPEPRDPAALLSALTDLAADGRAEDIAALLTDDAQQQTGTEWIAFIRRTDGQEAYAALRRLKPPEQESLAAARTETFLGKFAELSPDGFADMFDGIFYRLHVEEGDRLLVRVNTERGETTHLAMERQSDGTLRLAGEAVSRQTYEALRDKLNEEIRRVLSGEQ